MLTHVQWWHQYRNLIVHTTERHGGIPCPKRQWRECNTHACPTPAPPTPNPTTTPYPTPAPTPLPFSKPIIEVLDGDDLHVEATKEDSYVDAGATCYDLIDGNLNREVSVTGDVVNLAKPGAYTIKYDCKNSQGVSAFQAERVVYVEDNTCPQCEILPGPSEIEAGFPYADPGAHCYDSVDGDIPSSEIQVLNLPNVDLTGEYEVQYRVKDQAGNWNDAYTMCRNAHEYLRKVEVIDSLKPVLALVLQDGAGEHTVQMSNVVDESAASRANVTSSIDANGAMKDKYGHNYTAVTDPSRDSYRPENPANFEQNPRHAGLPADRKAGRTASPPTMVSLMAEDAYASPSRAWTVAAVVSAAIGAALLVYTASKRRNAALPPV